MPTLRFRIGHAFPAGDPVARFIAVVAMMSNDWLRLATQMRKIHPSDPDAGAVRIMSFRLEAALYYEGARFIADACRRFPEIAAFINDLDDEARQDCEKVMGGVDPRSQWYLGDWVEDHRNVTFHYPEMHPDKAAAGKEEISNALVNAAVAKGTVTRAEADTSVRFRFADELGAWWLPDTATEGDSFVTVREAVLRLSRFARSAASAYLESRPAGTIERVD
jgi:hypothetical protein